MASQSIGRRNLLMLLVGVDDAEGFGGMTRLQKFLFLLEKEEGLSPTNDGFEFEPYKAGPYSSRLYDDIEFLENLGFLEGEVTAEASEPEAAEIDRLSFDHLIGGDHEEETPDSFEERRFRLLPKGREKVEELLKSGQLAPVVDKIRRIKSRFGRYSLNDLLYYVYTKYPDMTTESEIKDQVLRRGERR